MGWFAALAAFIPPLIILYVVGRQSKTFAAFAQMGSIQSRLSLDRLGYETPPSDTERLARRIKVRDKLTYTLGVINVALTAYILGACPTLYYLWHTPKIVVFTFIRWIDFSRTGQHYLLWDFCYWANGLLLVYLWLFPHSALLFRISWCVANGPLAWSTLAFSHSLIFHSYPHLTSVIIHVSPALVTHGLRFHPSGSFRVCDDYPACESSEVGMVWDSLRYFYIWWILFYYVWVFVLMADRVKRNGYQTLFDRVVKGPGKFLAAISPHPVVQKAAYALIHLTFAVVSMGLSTLMWHSFWAHVLFIVAVVGTVSYNAAAWYFEVFLKTYQAQLMERARAME